MPASYCRSVISRTFPTQLGTGAIKCKYRTLKDFTLHTPTQQAAWDREKYKKWPINFENATLHKINECYAVRDNDDAVSKWEIVKYKLSFG